MASVILGEEREEKSITAEFLMLPCTAIGQTTSASIAEKSNIWAENKLAAKKCELDKKLYRNMIKLNSDMLGLTDELVRLRKSASSSSLESFNRRNKHDGFASGPNSPKIRHKSRPSSHLHISCKRNEVQGQTSSAKDGNGSGHSSPEVPESQIQPVSFHLSTDSSSDESERPDSVIKNKTKKKVSSKSVFNQENGRHGNELTRTISVTSCTIGRECGTNRADLISFQNATKRYNKQLSDYSKSSHKLK